MTSDDTTPQQSAPAAKKTTTRKTPDTAPPTKVTRKTAAPTIAQAADPQTKPEFAPTVTATGRLNHSTCGHPRTLAGRQKCRDVFKTQAAQDAATEDGAK